MTDIEAIEALKVESIQFDGNALRLTKFFEALGQAQSALQEREERSRGCEVCNTNPKAVWYRFKNRNVLCSFCPVCGRRLKTAMAGEEV